MPIGHKNLIPIPYNTIPYGHSVYPSDVEEHATTPLQQEWRQRLAPAGHQQELFHQKAQQG
jgi:hypothetical protein